MSTRCLCTVVKHTEQRSFWEAGLETVTWGPVAYRGCESKGSRRVTCGVRISLWGRGGGGGGYLLLNKEELSLGQGLLLWALLFISVTAKVLQGSGAHADVYV